MRVTLSVLRRVIREELLREMGSRGRSNPLGDPSNLADVLRYVMREFDGIASDMGVDDPSDEDFGHYIATHLLDLGVSRDVIKAVLLKLNNPLGLRESVIRESEDYMELAHALALTPEYASIENLVQFLMDEDREEFTHIELKALAMNLRAPLGDVRKELESYGFRLAKREPEKRVRGFTTSSHDRWYGPGALKTHGGAGIDTSTGRATVRGKTI